MEHEIPRSVWADRPIQSLSKGTENTYMTDRRDGRRPRQRESTQ